MAESTQTKNPAPAGSEDTSTSTSKDAGSDSKQSTNAAPVDGSSVEAKDKAADSGAERDEGERQRPGRAERRISELSSQIKQLESQLEEQNQLADKLKAPVDPNAVNLPDYSQMTEITPDQIKKDIVSAATQIVDLRMQTTANTLEQRLNQRQATEKSAAAIESALAKYSVLNPESEDYDQTLDSEISGAYADVLQKDPGYSFSRFIKPMERFLAESSTTPQGTTTKTNQNRGTAANRAGGQSRSQKPFEEMTTKEMEDWFASKRSR